MHGAALAYVSFEQVVTPKKPFSPHDVNDINHFILCAIEDTSWGNNKLSILCAFEFRRNGSTLREICELFDPLKYALNKLPRGCRLIE